MATLAGQKTETSNRIRIMFKNKQIARAQSFRADTDFGAENVYEIGNYMPRETVLLKYQGTLTLNKFRTTDSMNLADDGMDISAIGEDILTRDVLDVNVTDTITNALVVTYRQCTSTSLSFNWEANQIAAEEMSMYFRTASNGRN